MDMGMDTGIGMDMDKPRTGTCTKVAAACSVMCEVYGLEDRAIGCQGQWLKPQSLYVQLREVIVRPDETL